MVVNELNLADDFKKFSNFHIQFIWIKNYNNFKIYLDFLLNLWYSIIVQSKQTKSLIKSSYLFIYAQMNCRIQNENSICRMEHKIEIQNSIREFELKILF